MNQFKMQNVTFALALPSPLSLAYLCHDGKLFRVHIKNVYFMHNHIIIILICDCMRDNSCVAHFLMAHIAALHIRKSSKEWNKERHTDTQIHTHTYTNEHREGLVLISQKVIKFVFASQKLLTHLTQ